MENVSTEERFIEVERRLNNLEGNETPTEKKAEWAIVCSDCKKDATVPFEPFENSKVQCRDCYSKRQ